MMLNYTQYVANTYRKDRTSHGTIRDGHIANKVDIYVDTDSQQVWARVELPGENKPLHVVFTDHQYMNPAYIMRPRKFYWKKSLNQNKI